MTASEDFPQFRSGHLGTGSDTTQGAHLDRELAVIAHEETRPNDVRRHFRLPGLVCTHVVTCAPLFNMMDRMNGVVDRVAERDGVGSCDRGYEIVNRFDW